MTTVIAPRYSEVIHPLHAVLLAGTIPLWLGAALSDAAYAATFEIQWNNFASWLIVGGLFFSGLALIFTIVDLFRPHRRTNGFGLYALLLLITWIVGFFNALMHARDAWASMPTGLYMSVAVAVLACFTAIIGFRARRPGVMK